MTAPDLDTERAGPLRDVRVLDLTRMIPGAMCTLLLADMGADVVKVEAPGFGDGNRRGFGFEAAHVAMNRGKRSLALDLRRTGAAAALRRLVGWADVVVESHRPGKLDADGMGYEAMSALHPQVVWCSITGFGSTGPNAAAGGHDLTFLGISGLLDQLADGPATPPATTISLPLAASHAALGILAGVLEARRSGVGARLEVSMAESAMWALSEEFALQANAPGPGWGTFAARNVYACADGRQVTVAATEPRTWAALCEGLEAPDLAGHRLGLDPDEPVQARLTELFATRPAADWVSRPGLAGGVGAVNQVADLLDDPQVTERASLLPVDDSDLRVLAGPVRFGGVPQAALAQPPELGADSDEVLREAGFSDAEIQTLRADAVTP